MKQQRTVLIILVIAAVLIAGLIVYSRFRPLDTLFNPQPIITTNTNLKTYTSQFLNISFQYPASWSINELGGRSINITDSGDKTITILITRTPMLQNQSFNDYIKVIDDRSKGVSEIQKEEDIFIKDMKALKRIVEPKVGNDLRKYIIIFIEQDGNIYTISATPSDSELISIFNQIVDSIEFK